MIEQHLIAACINSSHSVAVCSAAGVAEDWFESPSMGRMYESLHELSQETEWTTGNKLGALSRFFKKHQEATQIDAEAPPSITMDFFITVTLDAFTGAYMTRRIERLMYSVREHMADGDNPQNIMAGIAYELDLIGALESASTKQTSEAIADAALTTAKRIAAGECFGIPLPWISFNAATFGLPLNAMTPLAGRDGKGKSRLAAFLAGFWASQGYPVLVFPFEDMSERFFDNVASGISGYDTFTIKRKGVSEGHIVTLAEAYDKTKKLPIYYVDEPMSADRLASIVAEYKRRYGIMVVIVDGIKDLIMTEGNTQTEKEGIMMATLVRCMKRNHVAGLGVFHMRDIDDDKWLTKGDIVGNKNQTKSARMVMLYQDYVPARMSAPYGSGGLDGILLDVTKCSYGNKISIMLKPRLDIGMFEEIRVVEDKL